MTCAARRRYSSVLPLPVTPCSRTVRNSLAAAASSRCRNADCLLGRERVCARRRLAERPMPALARRLVLGERIALDDGITETHDAKRRERSDGASPDAQAQELRQRQTARPCRAATRALHAAWARAAPASPRRPRPRRASRCETPCGPRAPTAASRSTAPLPDPPRSTRPPTRARSTTVGGRNGTSSTADVIPRSVPPGGIVAWWLTTHAGDGARAERHGDARALGRHGPRRAVAQQTEPGHRHGDLEDLVSRDRRGGHALSSCLPTRRACGPDSARGRRDGTWR